MKKIFQLLFITSFVISLAVCSGSSSNKNDSPPAPTMLTSDKADYAIAYTRADNTKEITYGFVPVYSTVADDDSVSHTDAVTLGQLIPGTTIPTAATADLTHFKTGLGSDYQTFFVFEFQAADRYSSRGKSGSNADLTWAQILTGYYLPAAEAGSDSDLTGSTKMDKTYFPSADIARSYDVKVPRGIYLYRKIDVKNADGDVATFYTGALTKKETINFRGKTIANGGTSKVSFAGGYSADQFISEYVTSKPENYNYRIISADGWINGDSDIAIGSTTEDVYSWDRFSIAYYLAAPGDNCSIVFPVNADDAATDVNHMQKKWVTTIELVAK